MNYLLNDIAASVFAKDFKDCNIHELKTHAEQYPYSSSMQLLYAQKLKEENSEHYGAQWQKTLLYFDNPLLVNYLFTVNPEIKTPASVAEESKQGEETQPLQAEGETLEIKETQLTDEKTSNETVDDKASDEIVIPGLKIEPIDPEKAALSFTPYHTIDYFASLGIKLSEEIKDSDRFGQQLRSFTAWLKQMRRLPEAEMLANYSLGEEQKVEKMAEKSVLGENAITAAMAEVWIKQNSPQRAIEIYQKLSLLNPAKSAYFAAKIEYLKKSL